MVKLKLIKDLGLYLPNKNSKTKRRYGLFECPICKKEFSTQTTKDYKTKSTKCKSCSSIIKKTTHGFTNTKIHNTWKNIKRRTLNKNNDDYQNYGGRGIKICEEWQNDFMAFYEWAINNGYQDNLTIDRINNDGNYEPCNCRWIKRNIQARNKRKIMSSNRSGYKGVSIKGNKYQVSIGIDNTKIYLGTFDNALDGAKAYDRYVLENNLEHTINGVL